MALIIGIRCSDAVVLAASGAAMSTSADRYSPSRVGRRALRVLAGQAVLGSASAEGLAQEMALSLERALSAPDDRETTEDVLRQKIREALAAPVQRAAAIHRTLQGVPGLLAQPELATRSEALLAIPLQRALRLYAFERDCSLTEITPDMVFAVAGDGRTFAESLLLFLGRVLWAENRPSLAQAELGAYWAVRHAVENRPLDLDGPVQLMVMSRNREGVIEIVERGERDRGRIVEAIARGEETIRKSVRPPGSAESRPSASAAGEPGGPKRVPEVRLVLEPKQRSR